MDGGKLEEDVMIKVVDPGELLSMSLKRMSFFLLDLIPSTFLRIQTLSVENIDCDRAKSAADKISSFSKWKFPKNK